MRKRQLSLCVLVALCVMLLARAAYALDAPFRLELKTQGDAVAERPYETWFFLEDGRAYATTGELCAYAKAQGEGGTEVITLAGGAFANDAIVVDAEGATAAAVRSGAACGFGVVAMPTPFQARLAGSQTGTIINFAASLAGGVGDAFTYRYHVYDGAGNLVCADVRAGEGAMSVAPVADGRYEAFVTATDAGGAVSDCASAAVLFTTSTAPALGTGDAAVATEPSAEDDEGQATLGEAPGLRREVPEQGEVPEKGEKPVKPDDKPVKPDDKPDGPDYTKLPINNNARKTIKGLQLYANPDGTGTQAVTNPNFNGSFNADVYQSILEDPLRGDGEAELTLMIYLCGTDLEQRSGIATDDLINVLETRYDLSRINVLVLAGGTMSWQNKVMQQNNNDVQVCLYYLDPNGIVDSEGGGSEKSSKANRVLTGDTADGKGSLRLLGTYDQACMGDPELLLGFLDTAYDLFPADHYWLSLWDHGGGSSRGICFGEPVDENNNTSAYRGINISDKGLTLANLEEALSNSKIVNEHGDLDILSTDACLMAGIELAYNLSPYVRFMIASEETTTGNVPYNDYLGMFRKLGEGGDENMSAGEIAVNAAKSFIEKSYSEGLEPATMSVYDLKKVDECAYGMNAFGYTMSALLKNDETKEQALACLEKSVYRTSNFGHSGDNGENYMDLYDLISRLRTYLANEQQAVAEGTEAHTLYQSAMTAIDELLQVPFVAYRGGLYGKSYMQQEDMTYEDDALTLDMSKSESTGLWGLLGYDTLCGATVFFPRDMSTPFDNYMKESIFPGYTDMIKEYTTIVQSREYQDKINSVVPKLEGNYGALIDGMKVKMCSYTDKSGIERHGLALYVSFSEDADPALTGGLDPVTLFSKAMSEYYVLVLRERPGTAAGDEEYIVVGQSGSLHSGMGTTGSVVLDTETGKLIDTSGLAFDVSMMIMRGYMVDATEGGAEGQVITDWGTISSSDNDLREALEEKKPEYAESWKSDFKGLEGAVHTAGEDGQKAAYDAILIFGANSKGEYEYKGAILEPDANKASDDIDDKDDEDDDEDDLFPVSADRWIPADANNSIGITLYHYKLNDKKNGLVSVENKDNLGEATFTFEKGAYPTLHEIDLADPDGKGLESQEHNHFALEIIDKNSKTSVVVGDDLSGASKGEADSQTDAGGTNTDKTEKAVEKDKDGTPDQSGQGSEEKSRKAAAQSGSKEEADSATTKETSSTEATGSSKESSSTDVTDTSKATDSTKKSDTTKETDTAKATDANKGDGTAKVANSSKEAVSSESTDSSKMTDSNDESSSLGKLG